MTSEQLSIFSIVKKGFDCLFKNFGPSFLVMFVAQLVLLIGSSMIFAPVIFTASAEALSNNSILGFLLFNFLLLLFTFPINKLFFLFVGAKTLKDESYTLKEAFLFVQHNFARFLTIYTKKMLINFLWFFALFIPGIHYSITRHFAEYSAITEIDKNLSALEARQYSRELMRNNFWRYLLMLNLAMLMIFLLTTTASVFVTFFIPKVTTEAANLTVANSQNLNMNLQAFIVDYKNNFFYNFIIALFQATFNAVIHFTDVIFFFDLKARNRR